MQTRITWLAASLLLVLASASGKRGGGGYSRGGGGYSHGGGHSYPASTGYSGASRPQTHTYPQSTGGSGHGQGYGNNFKHPRTDVHHHYHYSPPQQINYGSGHYPTYRGAPPAYVYHYRESGSRFDTLLTGLALYNLAMMSTHHGHSYGNSYGNSYGHGNNERQPARGEQCKLGVKKETGEYEENRVDCRLLTSLMLDADAPVNTVTKTITTNTVYDAELAPNTTLINGTHANVTSVTVTEAVSVKGPSIAVTPGMQCYLLHTTYSSTRKKIVPCGLLQSYAESSMRRGAAAALLPSAGLIGLIVCATLLAFKDSDWV